MHLFCVLLFSSRGTPSVAIASGWLFNTFFVLTKKIIPVSGIKNSAATKWLKKYAFSGKETLNKNNNIHE